MGHSTQHYTFDVDKNKKEISEIVNEEAIYESDSRSGLYSEIRFLENKIYNDEEEAYEAIKKLDKGWYDQLAVKFYNYDKVKDTKEITNLDERVNKAKEDLKEYKKANALKNRVTNYVGCKECGSKINKEYIASEGNNWNKCPLCGIDLSSNTIQSNINNKENKIDELRKQYINKSKENSKKGKKTVKWLVKTEYHI